MDGIRGVRKVARETISKYNSVPVWMKGFADHRGGLARSAATTTGDVQAASLPMRNRLDVEDLRNWISPSFKDPVRRGPCETGRNSHEEFVAKSNMEKVSRGLRWRPTLW